MAAPLPPNVTGAAFSLLPRHRGAALYERIRWLRRRLLPSMLKWTGLALALVSCALMVYLGAVIAAQLVTRFFFP